MDFIQKLDDILNKLKTVGQDGIPLKHSVDSKTVSEVGVWLVGGLLVAGAAAGTIIGLMLSRKR